MGDGENGDNGDKDDKDDKDDKSDDGKIGRKAKVTLCSAKDRSKGSTFVKYSYLRG